MSGARRCCPGSLLPATRRRLHHEFGVRRLLRCGVFVVVGVALARLFHAFCEGGRLGIHTQLVGAWRPSVSEAWLVGSSKFCRAELRCCVDQANLWVGGPLWGSWQLVASGDRRVNGAEADGKLMKQPEQSRAVPSRLLYNPPLHCTPKIFAAHHRSASVRMPVHY